MLRIASLLLAALVLAGCDDGGDRAATSTVYTLKVESGGFPKRLAPDECFAAVRGVVVLGHALGGPAGCKAVAARYFGDRRMLAWPPGLLRNPDAVSECTLRRGSAVLAVIHNGDDPAYELATRICDGLRRAGWRHTSLDALLDG